MLNRFYYKDVLEIDVKEAFMEKFLSYANSVLLFSALGLLATALLAYPFANLLNIGWLVFAHIGTLLFAIGIKISYVARLVFLSRLGRPVH